MRSGIKIRSQTFAVHQWNTCKGVDLVYGRAGDAVSGVGGAVARIKLSGQDQGYTYIAITYRFPAVSASAVSKLVLFATKTLPKLLGNHGGGHIDMKDVPAREDDVRTTGNLRDSAQLMPR